MNEAENMGAAPRLVRKRATVSELGVNRISTHEPSPSVTLASPSWVSVIKPNAAAPYVFIDLPTNDDIQGIAVDEPLNTVFGVTHVGEKMYAFDSTSDTTAYTVDIRAPFDAQMEDVPLGSVLHMHDLAVDTQNHRVYQTIHTLAPLEAAEEEVDEIQGHWVAEVDTLTGNTVTIIDVAGVHAHFVDVDHTRKALLVSGEHTGNLGVVDTKSRTLEQVIQITPANPDPLSEEEPEVHGVNINRKTGAAYISDETGWNQTVTILKP
jgi:DNA-binding beta-propeller fold protein YncE